MASNTPPREHSGSSRAREDDSGSQKLGPRLTGTGMEKIPDDHETVLDYKDKVVGK